MDVEFTKWLLQLGTGGAIAGLLFFFYRKDVKAYSELWQAQAAINHEQTQAMMELVAKNSATVAANTEVLKSLHKRMDRLDILRLTEEGERSKERP
jgi:hypothetical protein